MSRRGLRRVRPGGHVSWLCTSAALAQSVEHLTRNEKVVGSIPTGGSTCSGPVHRDGAAVAFPAGQTMTIPPSIITDCPVM
jgi:hypothetical protein